MQRRKGMLDILVLGGFMLIVLTVFILVSTYLKDQIFPDLQTMIPSDTPYFSVIMTDAGRVYNSLDVVFFTIAFGLGISSIILAYFVYNHPVFFAINLFILIILFLISPIFENFTREFWLQFPQYASGGGGSVTYPTMTNIWRNIPIVIGVLAVALAIVQFAKPHREVGAEV